MKDDEKPELFRPISAKVESKRNSWGDTTGSRLINKPRSEAAKKGHAGPDVDKPPKKRDDDGA